jgi:hypothetical protein
LPEILKIKHRNRIPEPGTTISGFADKKKKKKRLASRWFSLGTLISSTNKTDCHDIAEILLIGALNTINKQKLCRQL